MYSRQLRQDGHTRRFEISENGGGWDARTMIDRQVVKQARYDDWHRVERAMLRFDLEVLSLQEAGWRPD